MLPSARLFLNRDVIHKSPLARQRAQWLYDNVCDEVLRGVEPVDRPAPVSPNPADAPPAPPFPKRNPPAFATRWRRKPEPSGEERKERYEREKALDKRWGTVAEVAEDYPRLFAWLAEGQVSPLWNVFGVVVGMARLLPFARRLLWGFMFERVARHAPWRAALRAAILQELRNAKNKEVIRDGSTLTIHTAVPGLSAVTDVSVITPTRARADLRRKIAAMSSGVIGVSGLRGAGKTALIREFCAHRYGTPEYPDPPLDEDDPWLPGLRVMVQAPLRFDAREYLIHQYACLCRAVLADVRFNPDTLLDHLLSPFLFPRLLRPARVIRALGGAAAVAAFCVLVYLMAAGGRAPHWSVFAWEVTGAVITGLGALVLAGWRTRWSFIEVEQIVNLAEDAERRLRRLSFLRTDTRSGGGTLAGPLGLGLSAGTSHELAEQPITLPELIDDYRDFVERIVAGLQRTQRQDKNHPERADDVRLVIGIDEIDRIGDPEAACRFLDELSSVFGTPLCVYLIAISPATQAAVDQRTVPLKTSSGGMFDEMVWLEPLGINEAARLLDHRVVGLPAAFIALCYVLSGGLPRELLRFARAVYTAPGPPAPWLSAPGQNGRDTRSWRTVSLKAAACHVIAQEIDALKHRALASAVTSAEVSAAPELLARLASPEWPRISEDGHLKAAATGEILADVSALWAGDRRRRFIGPDQKDVAPYTAEVCDSLLAGLYFLLTVRQVCAAEPGLMSRLAWPRGSPHRPFRPAADGVPWLDDDEATLRYLARARIALSTSPYLATAFVTRARERLAELLPEDFKEDIEPRFLGTTPARQGQSQ
jgi:hypothetical protein